MNASELLKRLHESGTGLDKIEAAKRKARAYGRRLRDTEAAELPAIMGQDWPEGTHQKALRLLAGLPADSPAAVQAVVYDIDDQEDASQAPDAAGDSIDTPGAAPGSSKMRPAAKKASALKGPGLVRSDEGE
jgi:hypothetical protein